MKSQFRKGQPVVILALSLCIVFTSTAAQAAVARVTVFAEVIDPAVIDASKIFTDATAGAEGERTDTSVQQVQSDKKVVTIGGVTSVTVDYN